MKRYSITVAFLLAFSLTGCDFTAKDSAPEEQILNIDPSVMAEGNTQEEPEVEEADKPGILSGGPGLADDITDSGPRQPYYILQTSPYYYGQQEIKYTPLKLQPADDSGNEYICSYVNDSQFDIGEDGRLVLSCPSYYCKTEWENGRWKTLKMNSVAMGKDGKLHLESFSEDEDGNLVLKERLTFDEENKQFACEDCDVDYIMLSDTSFSYMHGENLIDSVEFGTEPDFYHKGKRSIAVSDYNFDGYEDVLCRYQSDAEDYGPEKCIYYLFDPKKEEFVFSDSLNELADKSKKYLYASDEDKTVSYSEYGVKTDDPDTIWYYRWEGDKLKLAKRKDYWYNITGESTYYLYEYDEKGEEHQLNTEPETEWIGVPKMTGGAEFTLYDYICCTYDKDGNLVYDGVKGYEDYYRWERQTYFSSDTTGA